MAPRVAEPWSPGPGSQLLSDWQTRVGHAWDSTGLRPKNIHRGPGPQDPASQCLAPWALQLPRPSTPTPREPAVTQGSHCPAPSHGRRFVWFICVVVGTAGLHLGIEGAWIKSSGCQGIPWGYPSACVGHWLSEAKEII